MPLTPGTRLGPYEVTAQIGVGGMGEVYRATDTLLGRQVAIKVLPEAFAQDDERLARFEREAKTLGALNHPHIAAIYGFEKSGGANALVMELVEGQTLAELLEGRRGPSGPAGLPIDEALPIATQIAEALEAAHEQGIIHRDLKPANIKVRPDGTVKVLDFGLAKLVDERSDVGAGFSRPELTASPTIKSPAMRTGVGVILGTAAYMSPEQARGKAVDKRADIWAFGCVCFELLGGRGAFEGDTLPDVLARVIEGEPDWSALPATMPRGILKLVQRCLQKDPKSRLHDIADARVEIEEVQREARGARRPLATVSTFTSEKSIIVLPFANQNSNLDDEYFSDGLTEELIADLTRIAELRVVPTAAAFRLKNTTKDLAAIGRESNVRYVVEGRVRRAGRNVRITAQLVDVQDDRSIWADKYTDDLDQVFEVQERISRAIADALQLRFRPPPRARTPEAAEAYLKGRHFVRQATIEGLRQAVRCFEQAIDRDPNYAAAFAALAETLVNLTTGWDALPAVDTMPKAHAAAQRAAELDPNLAEAHVALALVAMFYEWNLAGAEQAFKEALRLNPNSPDAHKWYAALLIWLDTRYDEALTHVLHAASLDPVDPWIQLQALWVHHFSRDFARGIEQGRRVIQLAPLYGYGHYALGCELVSTGQVAPAIRCFERGIELDGRGAHYVGLLGFAYAIAGQKDRALASLAELNALAHAGRDVATWTLHVYAGLSDADQVIQCLEQAIEQRSSSTLFVLTHPYVDFVRQDPRFVALLTRMGLGRLAAYRPPQEWKPG